MKYDTAVNTHAIHRTVSHVHLDVFVYWMMKEYPDAGLNLVECEDGRWYVEVDHGSLFDGMAGVSRPKVTPYEEPRFHASEQAALDFALSCIRLAHPELADRDLKACFAEYDQR